MKKLLLGFFILKYIQMVDLDETKLFGTTVNLNEFFHSKKVVMGSWAHSVVLQ